VATNSNAVSFTASGGNLGGAAILGIEIWDTAATPLRYLQGSITSVTVATGQHAELRGRVDHRRREPVVR
jgi:hypothetical protein